MNLKIIGPNDPALAVLKSQLERYPEWHCDLEIIDWENYQPTMQAALNQPVSPYQAVCVPGHIWLPDLVSNDKLVNFEQLLPSLPRKLEEQYHQADIIASVAAECKFDDQQYLLPLFTDGHLIFYRKDLISLGSGDEVPLVNPLDLMTLLDALPATQSTHPFALKAHASEILLDWLPYLWAAGGDVWDEQAKRPLFTSQAAISALEYYISLKQYCLPDTARYGNAEIASALRNGDIAMAVSWGGQAAEIINQTNRYKDQFGYAVFTSPWNATWGVGIPRNLPPKDQVSILEVLYLAASAEQDRMVTKIAGSPVRKTSYTNEELEKYPWLKAQKTMLETCRNLPTDPAFGRFIGPLYQNIHDAFTGKVSAADALMAAAK